MDEITQRLKDAADACIKTYETWRAKTSDHVTREALMDAVHELRKIAARLEIELAVADRQQNPNDPIPIPSHRAARRGGPGVQHGPADDIGNTTNDDAGNRGPRSGGSSRPAMQPRPPRPARAEGEASDGEGSREGKPLSLKRTSTPDAE